MLPSPFAANVQLFRVSSLAIGTWLRNLTSSNPRSPDLVIYGKEGALVYYLSHADLGYQVTVRLESIINFSRVGVDGVVLEVSEAPEMATAVSVPAGDKQIRMRWEPVGDFTDGSASVVRVHSIQCSQVRDLAITYSLSPRLILLPSLRPLDRPEGSHALPRGLNWPRSALSPFRQPPALPPFAHCPPLSPCPSPILLFRFVTPSGISSQPLCRP